jgi:hypothetical protein
MDFGTRTHFLRDIAEVPMVGEINHLTHFRHVSEASKRFLGAEIVERLHDIIGDERHRRA